MKGVRGGSEESQKGVRGCRRTKGWSTKESEGGQKGVRGCRRTKGSSMKGALRAPSPPLPLLAAFLLDGLQLLQRHPHTVG
eukprot:2132043-Pyramimonas_sp.AAC.1